MIGIPVGLHIDQGTMDIRGNEHYPEAVSDEYIEVECLEMNPSPSELQNPSFLFKEAASKAYRGLDCVSSS